MIQEIFLKKASNIRKEYLQINKDINAYEKMVSGILKSLEKNSNELENLKTKIDKKQISDVEYAKNEMLKIIINLEQESNKTSEQINRLNKSIEDLKKQEIDLYREIKEKYPEMSDVDIKNEIQTYIKNLS
jgi:chromosome segregation ATPase